MGAARWGRFLMLLRAVILAPLICAYTQINEEGAGPVRNPTTITGILLVSDWRCDEWPENVPKDKSACAEGSSQWGLITATNQYSVHGKTSELKKYERHRVTITGTISPGSQTFVDRLDVEWIAPSEVPEAQIRDLVEKLRYEPWQGPHNVSNPTFWIFYFTSPMQQILAAGPAAQNVLLDYLDDSQIKDQIIILLGGLGDGRAVEPIIRAMADREEARNSAFARKVNLAANLALTNITVADVIWHHGGGITRDSCPDDPKSCWYSWWIEHRGTFSPLKTWSRNYSNYPNYGIYQSPGVFRSQSAR